MSEAWIVATASTPFQKWPERGFRSLAEEVVEGLLVDAGLPDGAPVEGAWFANCAMGHWGQHNIRGQTVLDPLQRAGRLPSRLPVVNVEAGCATGSVAFHGAVNAVKAGTVDMALAIGVEKTLIPDSPEKTFAVFDGGIDQRHKTEWQGFFAAQGDEGGVGWDPQPWRILFLDVHAMQARHHMARHGTTPEQLAAVASKNHLHGSRNPRAQYRFTVSPEQVLADKAVVTPFTRAMCCPLSDGAAGLLVVSRAGLERLDPSVRARALKVRASVLEGGAWRTLAEPNVLAHAARKLWHKSGARPEDVDVAEVHDATAYCELHATELLGFCAPGEGGAWAQSGASRWDGERPVNPSGGLESKGHPLGATGLGQLDELVRQLRGEAGETQVRRPVALGLQQNAGGLIGLDEALCHVALLERT
jgi:acetyl-CoA acetyltransferase